MEGFESLCAVALESEGYVVMSNVKFDVPRKTKKKSRPEIQTHGYEVDLVGASKRKLVLASVKSYFGSRGVAAEDVIPSGKKSRHRGLYRLLNDKKLRTQVIEQAALRYGYQSNQVELRLYVGRFAAPIKGTHELKIRRWANRQNIGSGPIKVYSVSEILELVEEEARSSQYRDDPSLITLKALQERDSLAARRGEEAVPR